MINFARKTLLLQSHSLKDSLTISDQYYKHTIQKTCNNGVIAQFLSQLQNILQGVQNKADQSRKLKKNNPKMTVTLIKELQCQKFK